MKIDSTLYRSSPATPRAQQEMLIYRKLEELGLSYTRADHDPADTIAFCHEVEAVLGASICKNLFLCNRQQTDFYLLLMPGDKPFKTKDLSPLLNCSRLSFASPEHMAQYLQTTPGSVSALELLFDTTGAIRLVIDKALLNDEFICGHPGFSTSTLKLKRNDLLTYVTAVAHPPTVIDLPVPE